MPQRAWVVSAVLAALVAASAAPVLGQTTGRIWGVVTDSEGRDLPGATLTVSGETLLGGTRVAVSGEGGGYRFSSLPVGLYTLKIEMDGFQPQSVEGVQVGIDATATVNFQLSSEFTEELTVMGEAPLVDVASSSVGSNYSSRFIEDLPTARNFYDLMAVSPGISPTSEGSDRQVAFGSNMQSNAWHVDGIDTSAPETGSSWWYINPDTIAEVQVLGIGAPAEYGDMLGAAFNVVTKSGSNELSGGINTYWQSDSLTDSNFEFKDSAHPGFHREKYYDVSGTLGGPLKRDRLWYFGAIEYWRDGATQPGVDPAFTPINHADRYDLKLSARLNAKNLVDLKMHYEDWGYPDEGNAFTAPSALGGEAGTNPAGSLNWQSIASDRTFFEVKYAGWWSDDINESQTGSQEPGFIDYSPPGGGPATYSGGLYYPWSYDTWRQQLDATASHYTDDFLAGDHDFKFGVQFGRGSAKTKVAPGVSGTYYYHYAYDYYGTTYDYFYKVEGRAYFYGAEQKSAGAFVSDTWRLNDRLTLNVGVRYDHHEGWIPGYDRLDFTGGSTGEKLPGVDPALTWDHVSPRLGFAYNAGAKNQTVVRGSFGVYYDGNVSGNWDFPPPQHPGLDYFLWDPGSGATEYLYSWSPGDLTIDPNLKAPRTLQYALGFERVFKERFSCGAQVVYKDTTNLVGWEFLDDGVYEPVDFVDPFTGRHYTLLNEIEQATVRKGNRPGVNANPNATEYYQDYKGLVLTLGKRWSNGWDLMASYTLSESKGLIPRMLSDSQFNPFYASREGSDPNNFINADQLLQGDRRHMFRAQANFDLPWGLRGAAAINLQDGRPYNRQIRVPLNQGLTRVIMDPASNDQRFPFQRIVDLSVGKHFDFADRGTLKVDLQFFNLLNDDANEYWETLVLQEGDSYVPRSFLLPRRLMVRLGYEF